MHLDARKRPTAAAAWKNVLARLLLSAAAADVLGRRRMHAGTMSARHLTAQPPADVLGWRRMRTAGHHPAGAEQDADTVSIRQYLRRLPRADVFGWRMRDAEAGQDDMSARRVLRYRAAADVFG